MIIECPTCHTNYDVGNSLPPEGRNVRCASCHNVWLAQPDIAPETPSITSYDSSIDPSQDTNIAGAYSNASLNVSPENVRDETAIAAATKDFKSEYDTYERIDASPDLDRDDYFDEVPDTSINSTEATAKNFERHFEEPISNGFSNGSTPHHSEISNGHDLNPTRPDPTSIGNRIEEAIGQANPVTTITQPMSPGFSYLKIVSWITALSIMIGALLFALSNPDRTARALPSTVGLYAAVGINTNSRGLEISDVKYDHTTFEGRPALHVSGSVKNITGDVIKVPSVIIELRDKDKLILFIWATKAEKNELDASAQTPFNVTIPAPTKLVKNLKIRFSTRP